MADQDSAAAEERARVLVVDDEKFIRDILADFLGMEGYLVRTAEDGRGAMIELQRARYDMVISDLKMPNMGGIELLKEIAANSPDTLTVIMTGFGTVETAIDAMKKGAYDYILKPFKVEEIIHIVQRGLEKRRLEAENLRLREAISLYRVSEAIGASLSLDEVISTVENAALRELHADIVSTWIEDGAGGFVERSVAHRFSLAPGESLGRLCPIAIVPRLALGDPLVRHGNRACQLFAPEPTRPVSSVAVVPLKMRERLVGWLAVVSLTANRRFEEGQRKLLSIIASRAAASIENARLYQDLQGTFKQTIQSLARAIDKMDRYTAGHSERVARYAVALAGWIGQKREEVEVVGNSALMHDIGKIGCVMNLNKPEQLTEQEYEIFKMHPVYGREILDPIKFLQPVIPGVHLHHERWDGAGYPLGMVGQDIPLLARIIAIADTYDAMTSDRAYRRAMPHELTVNELKRCSGTQLDPDLTAVFTGHIDRLRDELQVEGVVVPE